MKVRAWVGFDGFIDRLAHVVSSRNAKGSNEYERIPDFADRLHASAGISCDLELNTISVAPGGNAPIMAQAMGRLGIDTTLVAALGENGLHPAYERWKERCRMISVGAPADTLALEFQDGKVMLADLKPLDELTWERVKARAGLETIRRDVRESQLVALTCYSLLAQAKDLWDGFRTEVLDALRDEGRDKTIFFDLADPSKHDAAWIRECCDTLAAYRVYGRTSLGLNYNEAVCLMKAYSIDPQDMETALAQLYEQRIADVLLVHPRNGCYAADAAGVRWHEGNLVEKPVISTGGGDHFNAGFCAALLKGYDTDAAVKAGMRVSHEFVKTGKTPEML